MDQEFEDELIKQVVEDSFEETREDEDAEVEVECAKINKAPLCIDLNEPAKFDFDLNKIPDEIGEEVAEK